MQSIEAKKQVRLGSARALQLALSGMMHRFFRAGVTVTILCLAVAFLVHTLMYGLLSHATGYEAYREIREQRGLDRALGRFLRADEAVEVIRNFGTDSAAERLKEYHTWGDLSEEEMNTASRIAERVLKARQYFDNLTDVNRAVLTGEADMYNFLRRLQRPEQYQLFNKRIEQLGVTYPLDGEDDFQRLAGSEWPQLNNIVERVREGHNEAIKKLRKNWPDRGIRELVISPPSDFQNILEKNGFDTSAINFERLSEFAARAEDIAELEFAISEQRIHVALSRRLGIGTEEMAIEPVFQWLNRGGDAEWFSEQLRTVNVEIEPSRLPYLAEYYTHTNRLQKIAGENPPEQEAAILSLEGRLRWLILLAFCVCIVGVANAMLMSVTERFTEIATMKCLGALDGFVMMMFVFEAAIQGMLGGLVGIALGALLAFARGFIEFGTLLAFSPQVITQVILAAALSLATGVMLAVLAAVGPSLVAARLAPMEAMRAE